MCYVPLGFQCVHGWTNEGRENRDFEILVEWDLEGKLRVSSDGRNKQGFCWNTQKEE